jgi:hypothetical protein
VEQPERFVVVVVQPAAELDRGLEAADRLVVLAELVVGQPEAVQARGLADPVAEVAVDGQRLFTVLPARPCWPCRA